MKPPTHSGQPDRAGFSLIELLIAMTMLLAITAAAWSLFQSQSKNFRANIDRWEMIQSARAAIEGGERVIRTMGAGTPAGQPILVYGGGDVLSFNTDYIERDTVDMRWAAYFNPDTPTDETTAWDVSVAGAIPNSSPTYTYPSLTYLLGNGSISPAETYTFYFELDATSTRSDDYVMYQRVNNGTPEVVARNILPHPNGKPFFQYLLHRVLPGGDTLLLASGGELPLIRRDVAGALTAVDTANFIRPDSVRAVQLNFRLTNGRSGVDERFRDMTTTVEVPNNGIALPTVCGRPPIEPPSLTATDDGSGRITLNWLRSADQDAGEQDVGQYILFRRLSAATTWAGPLVVQRRELNKVNYSVQISDNLVGTSYTFGIAAQDCTPSQSTIRTLTITPGP